jgi:two-component system phosphate regulon response regulator PhoB
MTASTTIPTVLVVDDSELVCESVKHTLEPTGMAVVALNSPFGFIKTIREHQPSLILLDVGLGILNGAKLVQLGRKNAPPGCPILLYSSRDAAMLQVDVAASQADGFITKSTTGKEFVTAVMGWISRARTRR